MGQGDVQREGVQRLAPARRQPQPEAGVLQGRQKRRVTAAAAARAAAAEPSEARRILLGGLPLREGAAQVHRPGHRAFCRQWRQRGELGNWTKIPVKA